MTSDNEMLGLSFLIANHAATIIGKRFTSPKHAANKAILSCRDVKLCMLHNN
jgi:hypothetical protein